MKSYLVTFETLDGNTSQVYVDAKSIQAAEMVFAFEYEYAEILVVECVDENEDDEYEQPIYYSDLTN